MKKLPIGVENFKDMIDKEFYYVDKTDLISEIMNEQVVLFTRPRRFGKTLNMSMLYYFFSNKEKENAYLFDHLNIADEPEAMKHLNQYPVITVSLKELKCRSYSDQIAMFKDVVKNVILNHSELLSSPMVDESDQIILNQFRSLSSDEIQLRLSLKTISRCLYSHYHKKVIILIDEYDVPLQAADQYGYYDQMVDFIRSVFSSALKTNDALEKGIMTGCLRISRESIFTGLNNFKVNSILEEMKTECFGFNENEVKQLLHDYQLSEYFSEVKEWYDGYLFGKTEVYNPWSTLMYVDRKSQFKDCRPAPFWANTSGNDIVVKYIESGDRQLKQDLETLMKGGFLVKPILPELTYREMDHINYIYSFLLLTGYLKAVENCGGNIYKLVIPNKEVYEIYHISFMRYFDDIRIEKKGLLYDALINRDAEKANTVLNDILFRSISYYDNVESFYHGFLMGVLNDHELRSNKEAGNGRFDICVYPDSILQPAVVIECKHSAEVRDLIKDAEEAAQQIKEKKYFEAVREEGYSKVIGYGISFCKKQCYVMVVE